LIASTCVESLNTLNNFIGFSGLIIFVALAIKAGIAPFHLWFPQVINCISWIKCIIILVWQKIAPFILISSFYFKNFIYFLIIISALVGALGGLNQTELKLLITYSSISHSAWLLILRIISLAYWSIYFLIYSIIVMPIISMFAYNNLTKTSEIFKTKTPNLNKNILTLIILSLGGLPPLLGFSAKLIAINIAITSFPLIIIISLISSSLISLFFYTKIFYNLTVRTNLELKINLNPTKNNFSKILIISIIGNMIISLLVLLI